MSFYVAECFVFSVENKISCLNFKGSSGENAQMHPVAFQPLRYTALLRGEVDGILPFVTPVGGFGRWTGASRAVTREEVPPLRPAMCRYHCSVDLFFALQ